MEQKEIITTESKFLSQLDFKPVELLADNYNCEYAFLQENLRDFILEELRKYKISTDDTDFKLYYDLGYNKGSGLMFEGIFAFKNFIINVEHEGFYYHENSKNLSVDGGYFKNNYIHSGEFSQNQDNKAEEVLQQFDDLYKLICIKARDIGRQEIEEEDKDLIIRKGLEEYINLYNFNGNIDCYDIDYITEEKEGFVKVCDSGDTNIKGVWIKDCVVTIKKIFKIQTNIVNEMEFN
jgi:hypothetical protein